MSNTILDPTIVDPTKLSPRGPRVVTALRAIFGKVFDSAAAGHMEVAQRDAAGWVDPSTVSAASLRPAPAPAFDVISEEHSGVAVAAPDTAGGQPPQIAAGEAPAQPAPSPIDLAPHNPA